MPRSSPKAAALLAQQQQQLLDIYRSRSEPDQALIYALLLIVHRHGVRGLRQRIDRMHAALHRLHPVKNARKVSNVRPR